MEYRARTFPKVTPLTLALVVVVVVAVTLSGVCCDVELTNTDSDVKKQIDDLARARYLLFPHIYRAFIDAGRSPQVYNVSSECERDLVRYYGALNEQKGWAWRMYDATGKQGAGLFMGALTWKGNFQECLNVLNYKTTGSFFEPDVKEPRAQYCSVFLATPHWVVDSINSLDLPFPVPLTPFISDVCVPSVCSEQDLSHVVQTFVSKNTWGRVTFVVTDTRCFKGRDITKDPAALWTASMLIILVCCVGGGTAYDIYNRRRKLRVKHGPEYTIGHRKRARPSQYGILKVILAPPSKDKLRRRNTIGGYEKSTCYELSETKVDRDQLTQRKLSSMPDLAAEDKQSQPGAKEPTTLDITPLPDDLLQKKLASIPADSPTDNDNAEVTATDGEPADDESNDERDGPLTMTAAPRLNASSDDANDREDTDDSHAFAESEDTTFETCDEVNSLSSAAEAKPPVPNETPEEDDVAVLDVNTEDALDECEPESDLMTPLLQSFSEETTISPAPRDSSPKKTHTLDLSKVDIDAVTDDIFSFGDDITAPLLDTIPEERPPRKLSRLLSVSDPGGLHKEAVETLSKAMAPLPNESSAEQDTASHDTNEASLEMFDVASDLKPLMLMLKSRPNRLKTEELKRSSSDPNSLYHTPEEEDSVFPSTICEIEIPAPAKPSPKKPTKPRKPKTPTMIKHTPGFARQGSIYERQLSNTSSEEDSAPDSPDPEFQAMPHTLYDIPEETVVANGTAAGDFQQEPEIEIRQTPIVRGLGLMREVILSFSFRRSTKRVVAEGSPDTLFCLNGVRVLSISWIVLGNVYMILYLNPDVVDNHVDGVKLTQTLWVQAVINTTLAADSFYILSGTLGAYGFMKLKKNFKGKKMSEAMTIKEYFLLIFHRLVRIGPCYWLTLLMFTNLMPYMGKGPRWEYEIQAVATCKEKWWSNALFFSNFYQADTMCMPHTYYLVNDFQFALLSPLFLIPLLCNPIVGFIMLGGLVMIQILSTLVLDMGINGNVLRMGETDYFSKVYVKPYCRIGVYAIGLGLGYILHSTKRQMKFRKLPLTILWILAMIVISVLPYVTYLENRAGGAKWSGMGTAAYEALSRPLWGLALAWVIYACSTGQGAFINKFLSWNAFLPLCRITYGVYLLHPMLIAVVISSRHNGIYIDFAELTYEFVANLVVSYLLAFLLITFVECPFASIESNVKRHIAERKKKANQR